MRQPAGHTQGRALVTPLALPPSTCAVPGLLSDPPTAFYLGAATYWPRQAAATARFGLGWVRSVWAISFAVAYFLGLHQAFTCTGYAFSLLVWRVY